MDIIEQFKKMYIIQVGAGGTGSWLVPLVSKFVHNISNRLPETTKIFYDIIDDDIVEDRNIIRQNFMEWDISKSKVQSLVNRYCVEYSEIRAKPIHISTAPKFLNILLPICVPKLNEFHTTQEHYNTMDLEFYRNESKILYIILGCVDNIKTRNLMYRTFKKICSIDIKIKIPDESRNYVEIDSIKCPSSAIYIDSGNNLNNGQIVTTWFNLDQVEIHNKDQKQINFTKMFKTEEEKPTQSCAFFGDQSQSVNNLAAALMFCNLQNIFVNNTLPPNMIEFNSTGWAKFSI